MKMFRRISFVVFFSLTYFSSSSHAQYLTGPVANSLGGAGRAAVDEGEQILLNPATVVHATPFTSGLFYLDGYTDENEHETALGLTLADNTEELLFSGGYAYIKRRRTFANFNTREEQYHQLSFGRFIIPHLSAGFTITFLDTRIVGGDTYSQWDGHAGIHYNPLPDLGLAAVFYNIFSRDEAVPHEVQNLDKVVLAAHYIYMPMLRLRLDVGKQLVYNPEEKLNIQFGVESRISQYIALRMGLDNNRVQERENYTLGLGFDGPRLKIDYFYKKNQDFNEGALHGVDMRMPFW